MKKIFTLFLFLSFKISGAQNIAVNTTGTAAATTNMFEVTQASTTTNTVGIFATHTGAATNAYAIWAATTGATNKYAIVVPPNSGYVGFGTITPTSHLEVSAVDQQTAITIVNTTSTAARNPRLNIYNYGPFGVPVLQFNNGRGTSSAATATLSGDGLGNIDFGGHTGAAFADGAQLHAVASENWSGTAHGSYLAFTTTANTTGTVAERMRIDQNGNVGIGTNAPEVTLHVANELTSNPRGILSQQSSNDANSSFLVLRKGRGTVTSPLVVQNGDQLGTINSEAYDGSTFLRTGAFVKFVSNGTVAAGSIPTDVTFGTGSSGVGTERVRILSTGNVGIGTSAPAFRLTSVPDASVTYGDAISASKSMVSGDATSNLLAINWNNSSTGDTWRYYFADPDGGFGVNPGSLEIWEYPATAVPACCIARFRIKTAKGQASYPSEVVINESGFFGLGTSTPTSKLTVSGGYIQGTAETWGHQARTQGFLIMPEGASPTFGVTDDGAGNVVFTSTLIVMNPLSGSWIRVATGSYTFGAWGYMWVDIPPTTTRGTTVTPTVSAWVDADRPYDGRDRILIGQRMSSGKVYFNFGRTF